MGAKTQPISPPFGHKAGLPPSKKYLIVRQPLFYQCDLVTEKFFVLRYDKATINKQERGGEHENQAQSRSGDCQYEKEYGFSLNGKRS